VEDNPMWMYQPGGWYRMVKLHGTNAAVVVTRDGDVYAQSRNRIITPENDNCGFAAWVESQRAEWAAPIRRGRVFFGEWVGPGIQNGVAACQIPRRKFCVFSVFYPGDGSRSAPRGPDLHGLADTLRIPRQLVDAPDLTAEAIDAAVAACEECDPFIEHHFGIRGTGEGYVYYTFLDDQPGFKAKGAAHRVAKSRTPTTPPENASDVATFVSTYVTDARLEQIAFAVTQRQIPYPKETTGEFLKAFSADVMKEADLGTLTWKEVGKAVNTAAAAWYRARSL
jgi:hypothetical protein